MPDKLHRCVLVSSEQSFHPSPRPVCNPRAPHLENSRQKLGRIVEALPQHKMLKPLKIYRERESIDDGAESVTCLISAVEVNPTADGTHIACWSIVGVPFRHCWWLLLLLFVGGGGGWWWSASSYCQCRSRCSDITRPQSVHHSSTASSVASDRMITVKSNSSTDVRVSNTSLDLP